jgi:hypothetical protein
MRYLIFLSLFLYIGCSQDSAILKEIKSKQQQHLSLSKTYYINSNSANIFIKDLSAKDSLIYEIKIDPKDIEESISIRSCKIDKKDAFITIKNSAPKSQWQSVATLSAPKNSKSKHSLECILSNGESLSKLIG